MRPLRSALVRAFNSLTLSMVQAKLGRLTSSGRMIPEIDGLRFIAICSVVIFHLSVFLASGFTMPLAIPGEHPWHTHIARHGHYGVQFFFVISGFILALPFASTHLQGAASVNLKRYYLRRLTRLEPPYLLIMVMIFCTLVWFKGQHTKDLCLHLVSSLVYFHGLMFGYQSVINPVAWSLEIEVQFYLLVPLLAQLFAIRRKLLRRFVIVGIGMILMALQYLFIPEKGPFSFTLASHLQYFLMGFLLVDIYLCEWNEAPSHELKWDYISVIGWPLLFLVFESPGLSQLLLPWMMFLLYSAAFRSVWVNRFLTCPLLTIIGGMCYTTYLIHYQLIPFIGQYTRAIAFHDSFSLNLVLQFFIIGPILLLTSVILFAVIERPCMREDWPRRAWHKAASLFRFRLAVRPR